MDGVDEGLPRARERLPVPPSHKLHVSPPPPPPPPLSSLPSSFARSDAVTTSRRLQFAHLTRRAARAYTPPLSSFSSFVLFCCGCATTAVRNPRLDGSISGQALVKTAGADWRHTRAARFLQRRWRARKRGEDISISMADVALAKMEAHRKEVQRMYSAEGWAEQKARQDAARKGYEQRRVLEEAKAKREKEEAARRAAEAAERRAVAEADVEAALREAASNQREGAPKAMHDPAFLLTERAESTGEDLSLALEILAGMNVRVELARLNDAARKSSRSTRGGGGGGAEPSSARSGYSSASSSSPYSTPRPKPPGPSPRAQLLAQQKQTQQGEVGEGVKARSSGDGSESKSSSPRPRPSGRPPPPQSTRNHGKDEAKQDKAGSGAEEKGR